MVVEVANNPWLMLLNLLIHDLFVENSMDVSSATPREISLDSYL